MFGLLKGTSCGLSSEARRVWWQHICGVCIALHRHVGQVSRLTTNYDSALISLLYNQQLDGTIQTVTGNCILRRPIKAQTVAPDNQGAQFGAAIALIMASIKLNDQLADGDIGRWSSKRQPTQMMADKWEKQGRAFAATLRFDAQPLFQLAQSQLVIEAQLKRPFDTYARPTEQAAGLVFAHTAVLANQPQNVPILQQMGEAYGRLMYLLDSYKDFKEDVQQGKFNALAQRNDANSYTATAQSLWRETQQTLTNLVNQLNGEQQRLSSTLLTKQLNKLGQKQLNMSHVCTHCFTEEVASQEEQKQKRKHHNPADAFCYCDPDCGNGDCLCCCDGCCCDGCCCDGDCDGCDGGCDGGCD